MKNFITLELVYFFSVVKCFFRKDRVKLKYRCSIKRSFFRGWNVISSGAYITDSVIGRHSYVGLDSVINNTTVGAFTCIGPRVLVGIGEHPTNRLSIHPVFYSVRKQSGRSFVKSGTFQEHHHTVIGSDVWIGAGVIIKDGVKIGNGAIVGSGAVVTRDVEDFSIVVGSPAREISKRLKADVRSKILSDPWWEKGDSVLQDLLPDFEIEFDD